MLATILLLALLGQPPEAPIRGESGNATLADPGWPKGAAAIFNHAGRVAWQEQFGKWDAEYRGDAKALTAVLAEYARMDEDYKLIILNPGIGHSRWQKNGAKINWSFMVWETGALDRFLDLPLERQGPFNYGGQSQIEVFSDGLKWDEVRLSEEIEVHDRRMEAHGFTAADGNVLEGKVTDIATGKPIRATVYFRRDIRKEEPKPIPPARADAQGRWILRDMPGNEWADIIVEAEGYVTRIVERMNFDDQPQWRFFNCGLSKPVSVSGRVTDGSGKPLQNVTVILDCVSLKEKYQVMEGFTAFTDTEGRFCQSEVPANKALVWLRASGYCRPGPGLPITMPSSGIELRMIRTAELRVTVDFGGTVRPQLYRVTIKPDDGAEFDRCHTYSQISRENAAKFAELEPGRYLVRGQPEPGMGFEPKPDGPNAVTASVVLESGKKAEIVLKAK